MAKNYSKEDIIALYKEDMDTMVYAQTINTQCRSRVDEIIAFSKTAEYKKIGIAHCVSVTSYARKLEEILSKQFETARVNCKVGGVPKADLVGSGWGAVCNPIMQAKILNDEKTDINIVMGLCVGHDMLFAKYSDAPSTTLIVKDEIYDNCPNEALK